MISDAALSDKQVPSMEDLRRQLQTLQRRVERLERTVGYQRCVITGLTFLVVLLVGQVALGEYGPRHAVRVALQDCSRLDPSDQPYQRYFWLPAGTENELLAFRYTLNAAVSSANEHYQGRVLDKHTVAVDLREILPDREDYRRVSGLLEEYVDPYMHVVSELRVARVGQHVLVRQDGTPLLYGAKQIKTLRKGRVFQVLAVQGKYVRVLADGVSGWIDVKYLRLVAFGLHLFPRPEEQDFPCDISALAALTQTRCPVITFPRFQTLALTQVDGGFYYQLLGFQAGDSLEKVLDERFGIDFQTVIDPDATNRVARFVSMVANGHPRAGKFGNTPGIRPTDGPNIWTGTEDISDEDVDVEQHAMYNLAGAEFRFEEYIIPRKNGMLAGLVVADKKLADVVDDTVARDHRSRSPHHAKVNGWFSCMRCHQQQGYQDFPNDVKILADANGGKLPIWADFSGKAEDQLKILDQLNAQYRGDMDLVLREQRRKHARAVFLACGAEYEKVYQAVVSVYEGYEYNWVEPMGTDRYSAGLLLGYPEEPLINLIPKLPPNAFGISPEDPTILGLQAWNPFDKRPEIHIRDWERIYPDAAIRVLLKEKQDVTKAE